MRYGTYNWLSVSTFKRGKSQLEKSTLAEERKRVLSSVQEESGKPAVGFGNARSAGQMFEETETERIGGLGEPASSTGTGQSCPSAPFFELRNSLPSDVHIISPFVDQLMRFISRFRRTDKNDFEIEMALREAIANAIVHGNQEDPYKRVYVWCRCTTAGEVSITVQDEGDGFDIETVPSPTAPENLFRASGRGIYLMKTLMDEVHFERRGAVVHMRKRCTVRLGAEGKTR